MFGLKLCCCKNLFYFRWTNIISVDYTIKFNDQISCKYCNYKSKRVGYIWEIVLNYKNSLNPTVVIIYKKSKVTSFLIIFIILIVQKISYKHLKPFLSTRVLNHLLNLWSKYWCKMFVLNVPCIQTYIFSFFSIFYIFSFNWYI